MKASDHSQCAPEDCVHRREAEAKEEAYYEMKRAAKLNGPEAAGYAEARMPQETTFGGARGHQVARFPGLIGAEVHYDSEHGLSDVELRAELVGKLESMLLEVRADQYNNGDPMPLQGVRNAVGDALRLLEAKRAYGDAWRAQGYMGNLARLQSKMARLRELLWRDAEGNGYPLPANYTKGNNETVLDTALDLVNLAGMFAVNWTEENRWGTR